MTGRKELVESQLLSPHASAPDYKMVERNLQDEIFALSHNWEALPWRLSRSFLSLLGLRTVSLAVSTN